MEVHRPVRLITMKVDRDRNDGEVGKNKGRQQDHPPRRVEGTKRYHLFLPESFRFFILNSRNWRALRLIFVDSRQTRY